MSDEVRTSNSSNENIEPSVDQTVFKDYRHLIQLIERLETSKEVSRTSNLGAKFLNYYNNDRNQSNDANELLAETDPSRLTLAWIFELWYQLSTKKTPWVDLVVPITQLLKNVNIQQARYGSAQFLYILEATYNASKATPSLGVFVTSLLEQTCQALDRANGDLKLLSPAHSLFIQSAVVSKSYLKSRSILTNEYLRVDHQLGTSGLHVQLYYYYGGLILQEFGDDLTAVTYYNIALSVPVLSENSVQLLAYKRWMLTCVLVYGRELPPPRLVDKDDLRILDLHAKWSRDFINSYMDENYDEIRKLIQNRLIAREGLVYLIRKILRKLRLNHILSLSKAFLSATVDMVNKGDPGYQYELLEVERIISDTATESVDITGVASTSSSQPYENLVPQYLQDIEGVPIISKKKSDRNTTKGGGPESRVTVKDTEEYLISLVVDGELEAVINENHNDKTTISFIQQPKDTSKLIDKVEDHLQQCIQLSLYMDKVGRSLINDKNFVKAARSAGKKGSSKDRPRSFSVRPHLINELDGESSTSSFLRDTSRDIDVDDDDDSNHGSDSDGDSRMADVEE